MSNSPAYDDLGGGGPSKAEVARRIRRAREELTVAEHRLDAGEIGMAICRLERASTEALGGEEE